MKQFLSPEDLATIDPQHLSGTQKKAYIYWRGFWDQTFWNRCFLAHWVPCASPAFHDEIVTTLNTGSSLILVPRGFGKTTVCLMRILRSIVYQNAPAPRTDPRTPPQITRLLLWMSAPLLRRSFEKIMDELETNTRLIAVFGHHKGRVWNTKKLTTAHGVEIEGTTKWSAIRGGRYDEIWADDIQETHEAMNPHQAQKILVQMQASLIPSLVPGGRMIITGTNVGRESLMQKMYDIPDNGYQKMWYKAVENPIWSDDGRLIGGDLLWPERFDLDFLEQQRALMGTRMWHQEYQNQPNGAELPMVFDQQMTRALPAADPVKTMVIHGVGEILLYKKSDQIVGGITFGIDTASGGHEGDYNALVGIDDAGHFVVQFRARCLQSEVAEVIDHLFSSGYRGTLVPERNFSLAFFDAAQRYPWYRSHMYRPPSGPDTPGFTRKRMYGITMTSSTKRQMIEKIHHAIRLCPPVSGELKDELEHFIYDAQGRPNAAPGWHDDLLVAYGMCLLAQKKNLRS